MAGVTSPLLTPRAWGAHLLAVVLVVIAGLLGYWQYDAWQQRRVAEARDLTRLDPVPLSDVIGPDDPFPGTQVGQPVVVEGTWLPEPSFFVTGRPGPDGGTGSWAVTPLAVGGPDGPAILVVRGWLPSTESPDDTAPPPPEGPAEFVAWLQPGEGTGAVDADPDDDVLPQLRIADALQRMDRDLYGAYVVVADEVAPGAWPVGEDAVNDGTEGLRAADLEQLPEVGRFTALRNLLYAVEWWVFGLFAAFIWWRWVRDEVDAEAPGSAR